MNIWNGLIFLWAIAASLLTAQAQTDTLPAHFSQEETIVNNPFARKWEFSLHGGWSYRVAKLSSEMPADFRDYANRLRSGYHVGASLDYFWREDMGVGLLYSRFASSGSVDNVTVTDIATGQVLGRGSMGDNIAVNFIAPSFNYRYIFPNRKIALQGHYAVGYLAYTNNAMLINESFKVTAQNFGLSLGAHLSIPLGQRLSLTTGVSLLGGSFSKFDVQLPNGTTQTIEADDNGVERENVSRIDVSAGLRFRL